MISSTAFDYINVLDRAADASWLREATIANNISNATTPGYKRYDVNFQSLLEMELSSSKYDRNLDRRVHNVHLNHLIATAQLDTSAESFSYRKDENNVDMHIENVELAGEQIRYQALTDSITKEFSRMKAAISK